jgi:hypothetical protein
MSDKTENYNLLVEPWIPILWTHGKPGRVSIRTALIEAGRIRQIAASNPMDNVALLRFLLAVLQWCKPCLTGEDCARLESAVGIPDDWVKEKLGSEAQPNPAFDLLGATQRFYQDLKLPKDHHRPIGDLLQEFPTETKVAHFRHVRDGQYGLCPSCCALGIVRFSAFANAYGHGIYPSAVNGPAPAYAIPQRRTLLQTLLLNCPENASVRREPPWLCDEAPSEANLDIVTVFAWRSRWLWLDDPGSKDELCSYCGRPARLIKRLAFTGGWKPPFQARGAQKKFWDQDPHLILAEISGKKSKSTEDTDGFDSDDDRQVEAIGGATAGKKRTVTTLGFPAPGFRVAAHARFWRRVRSARVSRADSRWRTVPLNVYVAGPVVNKGLYQDATALSLPLASSKCASAGRDVAGFMTRATTQLIRVLHESTPNPRRQHPNRIAALDARSPSLETRLRKQFDEWLQSAILPATPGLSEAMPESQSPAEGRSFSAEFWRKRLTGLLTPVAEAVVEAATPGSPLRRREAAEMARQMLNEAIEKLPENDMKAANLATGEKPKREPRKRGRK